MSSISSSKPVKYPAKSKPGSKNPNWKGGKVRLICEHCKTPFEVIPSRADKARYCSLACCNKSDERRQLMRERPVIRATGRRVQYAKIECGWCKTEFEIIPGKVGLKKFCCRECQFAWRKQLHSGKNNPMWRGGVRKNGYPLDWNKRSKSIRERDGDRCQNPLCLKKETHIVVHHIDYNKNNLNDENLITVCNSCNSRFNYRRDYWQAFLIEHNKKRLKTG